MYYTLIPEDRPDLAETEGWQELEGIEGLEEGLLAVIDVPAQTRADDSAHARWFKNVPHVPGGSNKIFHAVGLGRHRIPIYEASGAFRLSWVDPESQTDLRRTGRVDY